MACALTAEGLWETEISQVTRCGQKKKKVGWCAHSHMCGWEKYLRVRPQVPEKSALGIDPSTGHTTCTWEDLMTVPLLFPGRWVERLFQHVQLSRF